MTDEELSRAIDAAFSNIEKPDPENIAETFREENQRIQAFFANKDWKEISLDALQSENNGLCDTSTCLDLMKPEACAYYFPAFLKIIAFNYISGDVASDRVLRDIIGAKYGAKSSTINVINSFNENQKKVISDVLNKISREHESEFKNTEELAIMMSWNYKYQKKYR